MSDVSVRPTGHHILIRPMPVKKETDWGFQMVIEGSPQEKMEKSGRGIGEVIAMGPQAYLAHASHLYDYVKARGLSEAALAPWCRVGDVILYQKNAGKYTFDPVTGEEMYLVHDEDVQAVYPPYSEWDKDLRDLRL